MSYTMFTPRLWRARHTIVMLSAALGLMAASCVSTVDEEDAGKAVESDTGAAGDSQSDSESVPQADEEEGLPEALAFAAGSQLLGATSPSGMPFSGCRIDYQPIDWSDDPQSIVDAHAAASTPACTTESWYRETAFQNGILGFMVLVGEDTLAAAAPATSDTAAVADSLRQQGFDRLTALEIVSSGRCERGEIQAAVFSLSTALPTGEDLPGFAAIVESAKTSDAIVDRRDGYTVITGGGAPCTTAVVQRDQILAWITAPDVATIEAAVAAL